MNAYTTNVCMRVWKQDDSKNSMATHVSNVVLNHSAHCKAVRVPWHPISKCLMFETIYIFHVLEAQGNCRNACVLYLFNACFGIMWFTVNENWVDFKTQRWPDVHCDIELYIYVIYRIIYTFIKPYCAIYSLAIIFQKTS